MVERSYVLYCPLSKGGKHVNIMTMEIYNRVFAKIKEDYKVETITFSHLICEMEKHPPGSVCKAEYGLTAVAFLKNLQEHDALELDNTTYDLMYQKIIKDM